MKKNLGILSHALMLAALNPVVYEKEIYQPFAPKRRNLPDDRPKRKVEPIPPKGTKEYFFNIEGEFSTERMLKTECVFKCFATNDKNAIRKFNNWKNLQP
jgi:hypothetical protein